MDENFTELTYLALEARLDVLGANAEYVRICNICESFNSVSPLPLFFVCQFCAFNKLHALQLLSIKCWSGLQAALQYCNC